LTKQFFSINLTVLLLLCVFSFGLRNMEEQTSIVLCGLTDRQEQAVVAFNYSHKKSFASSDGSMLISIPDGWSSQDIGDGDFSTGILCDNDGASQIQLFSYRLTEEDQSVTPDSIIKQIDLINQPGGNVSYSVISENSLAVDTIKGKTFEISGSDRNGQNIHGLVTVFVRNSKCYIMSCITKEEDYKAVKDTFIDVSESLSLY